MKKDQLSGIKNLKQLRQRQMALDENIEKSRLNVVGAVNGLVSKGFKLAGAGMAVGLIAVLAGSVFSGKNRPARSDQGAKFKAQGHDEHQADKRSKSASESGSRETPSGHKLDIVVEWLNIISGTADTLKSVAEQFREPREAESEA